MQLFVFSAFPIHLWTIINMLYDVPSLLLYMTGSEILASLSYNMFFALIETVIVLGVVLAIGMLMPLRWAQNFVPFSSIILTELAIMMMLFQILAYRSFPRILLFVVFLLLLILTALTIPKYPKLQDITQKVSNRLSLLTSLYILIDLFGMIIVITRNM
jgi:hypothetical protein